MRHQLCGLTVAAMLWFTGCADNTATLRAAELPRPTEKDLLSANDQRFAAMSTPDVEQLQTLLDDGLVYTHSNAQVQGKVELLEALRTGELTYRKIKVESAHARAFPGGGTVTGTARIVLGKEKARAVEITVRYTAVLLNADGHLKLIAYESTRVPE